MINETIQVADLHAAKEYITHLETLVKSYEGLVSDLQAQLQIMTTVAVENIKVNHALVRSFTGVIG